MGKIMDINLEKSSFPEKKITGALKVGVIGAGKMGLLHSGIFNNLNGSVLSAISEKKKIISEVIKQCVSGIEVYQNYQEMLENERLDIVVITTPVFLHKKMIEDALNHNAHVFVEKPLAINGQECRSLLSKSYKNKTMVGYCRRFMDTYKTAKKLIEEKELGSINDFTAHIFVAQVFRQGKGWFYDPEKSGGGVLMDLGSHAIDMIHYLFGGIKQVRASGRSIYSKEVEDYVSVDLLMNSGVIGSLEVSWSVKDYRLPELYIEIHLDYGKIITTEKYIKFFLEKDTPSLKKGETCYYKQHLTKDVPINLAGPEYTLEDLHFLNCINNNQKPLCDLHEAAKTNFVIDKIYSSIKTNATEEINYEI